MACIGTGLAEACNKSTPTHTDAKALLFRSLPRTSLFMYFISIFGYTLKSIAQNEFSAPIYTKLVPNDPVQIQSAFTHLFMKNISFDPKNTGLLCNSTYMRSPAVGYTGGISCVQYGESIMRYLVISTNPGWKWGGVGFLIGE